MIVSTKFAHGPPALAGDLLGLGTAGFYGFYILAVARLRTRYGADVPAPGAAGVCGNRSSG